MALRERGLISLGLCCLIARRMALNSFQLFLSQIQAAPEVLKIRVLQIVFDILMVHDRDFLGPGSSNVRSLTILFLYALTCLRRARGSSSSCFRCSTRRSRIRFKRLSVLECRSSCCLE